MSIYGLLNDKCSYRRRVNLGSNAFNEIMFTELLIASSVPCSRQVVSGLASRQLIEASKDGTTNVKIVRYYMRYSETVQEGDIIDYSDHNQGVVKDVRDAAGRMHHKELIVKEVEEVGEKDNTSG